MNHRFAREGRALRRLSACVAFLLSVTARAPAAVADDRALAQEHFEIGVELVERARWDEALAEFVRSSELHPTPKALKNGAVCLRELGRHDEALDMYEALLGRFGAELGAAERSAVLEDVARITKRVGTLIVECDDAGAEIVVDGRRRGTVGGATSIRVHAGAHAVRVVREGFAPFEAQVEIAPGGSATLRAVLEPVARVGAVRVVEAEGRVFEVVVDGGVVGVTPWEGTLAEGPHTFALRGEHDIGARPRSLRVRTGESVVVTLTAELLPGSIRVEPSPEDASVWADGRRVARGAWNGTLPSGDHVIDVTAPWSASLRVPVLVASERPVVIRPELERVRRISVEIAGALLFGHVRTEGIEGCEDASCMGVFGGGRVGYEVVPHVGLGLSFGAFAFEPASTEPAERSASVSANFAAVSGEYQLLDTTPIVLRLSSGFLWGALSVLPVEMLQGSPAHPLGPRGLYSAVLMPEIRVGYRLAPAVAVDAGVGAMLFVLPAAEPKDGTGPAVSQGLGVLVPMGLGLRVFP